MSAPSRVLSFKDSNGSWFWVCLVCSRIIDIDEGDEYTWGDARLLSCEYDDCCVMLMSMVDVVEEGKECVPEDFLETMVEDESIVKVVRALIIPVKTVSQMKIWMIEDIKETSERGPCATAWAMKDDISVVLWCDGESDYKESMYYLLVKVTPT